MARVMRMAALEKEIQTTQIEKTKKGLLGELEVMRRLRDNLPNSYTVIWQPTFLEYHPDILIIEPTLGVLFLEVKNWNLERVQRFYLNGKIDTDFGLKNPLGQTQNYMNELQRQVNALNGAEKDIHRITTSMVVYAGFSKEQFLNREEVKKWAANELQPYLSKHVFIDELDASLSQRLKGSKKYKAQHLSRLFNEAEMEQLINILGVESVYKQGIHRKEISEPKKESKPKKVKYGFSAKDNQIIFGAVGIIFFLILLVAFIGIILSPVDDRKDYSIEEYEENDYAGSELPTRKIPLMTEEAEEVNKKVIEGEEDIAVSNQKDDELVEVEEVKEEEVSGVLESVSEESVDSIENEGFSSALSGTFSLGSTKEEVKNIMGSPTFISTYSNEWGYGSSTIEFDESDLVIGWTDYMENFNVSIGDSVGTNFSLGSTKQEVINAMGTPTSISTYRNEWGYSSSTVDFDDNDLVIGWTDYMENFNVSIGDSVGTYFSLGSTKQEVINAMGTPTSISTYRNEWGYGSSTVDFDDNDLVIGWMDYSQSLKIR